jgi:hypothetical protein
MGTRKVGVICQRLSAFVRAARQYRRPQAEPPDADTIPAPHK